MGKWYQFTNVYLWQMLLPFFVADVIATFFDLGICYCHVWLMLLPLYG